MALLSQKKVKNQMTLAELRRAYHQELCKEIIREKNGAKGKCPNFADGSSDASVEIAWKIVNSLGCQPAARYLHGQTAGKRFEEVTLRFVKSAFELLQHLRPGPWKYSTHASISEFAQYKHLAILEEIVENQTELASVFGSDYIIKPDIVIGRVPFTDEELNERGAGLLDQQEIAKKSPLRKRNSSKNRQILHASISCKWTLRSDRAQNTRAEALNLIRNRKGPLAHASAVTAEPLPTRLAALALGTGDLDCVYHFALPELQDALSSLNKADQLDMLNVLVEGDRLRDISDLPLDIAI